MLRPDRSQLTHPKHLLLWEKDQREIYGTDPHDYYSIQYRQRIAAIIETIKTKPLGRVLEGGCAQGNLSLLMSEIGHRAFAMDIQFDFLGFSKRKHEKGAVSWIQASADSMPFACDSFDCILLTEILEHCAFPEKILKEAFGLLKPGGTLVITTPNCQSIMLKIKSYAEARKDPSAMARNQFGADGDDHLFSFSFKELSTLLKASGFKRICGKMLGNHFLMWKRLYYLRRFCPFIWTRFFEWAVPKIPLLRLRYMNTLFFVVQKPYAVH